MGAQGASALSKIYSRLEPLSQSICVAPKVETSRAQFCGAPGGWRSTWGSLWRMRRRAASPSARSGSSGSLSPMPPWPSPARCNSLQDTETVCLGVCHFQFKPAVLWVSSLMPFSAPVCYHPHRTKAFSVATIELWTTKKFCFQIKMKTQHVGQGALGPFPDNLEAIMLGRVRLNGNPDKRATAVIRRCSLHMWSFIFHASALSWWALWSAPFCETQ